MTTITRTAVHSTPAGDLHIIGSRGAWGVARFDIILHEPGHEPITLLRNGGWPQAWDTLHKHGALRAAAGSVEAINGKCCVEADRLLRVAVPPEA